MITDIKAEYLPYNELDNFISNYPKYRDIWNNFTDEDKKSFWFSIHHEIESHSWKGDVLAPEQVSIFPRCYNNKIITWESDYNKQYNHYSYSNRNNMIILPVYWIASAVLNMIDAYINHDFNLLRKAGITLSKVDVLETEFNSKENPVYDYPLVQPLWDKMKELSLHYEPDSCIKPIKILRA